MIDERGRGGRAAGPFHGGGPLGAPPGYGGPPAGVPPGGLGAVGPPPYGHGVPPGYGGPPGAPPGSWGDPPPPKRGPHALVYVGLGCLLALLLIAFTVVGSCGACVWALQPGDLEYHAEAGSCWLDVVYLDASGKEVRNSRVRGPASGMTHEPWKKDVELGRGDRYKISVIPAQSCMREPTCWVTYRGATITPRTVSRRRPGGGYSALCEGTVPAK